MIVIKNGDWGIGGDSYMTGLMLFDGVSDSEYICRFYFNDYYSINVKHEIWDLGGEYYNISTSLYSRNLKVVSR